MILTLDNEQTQLAQLMRSFLAEHSPIGRVREVMDDAGWDRATWHRLGHELGVLGLGVPERFGGAGGGVVEQCVVAEELGATLTAVPFLSSVLAGRLLLELGDDSTCTAWLPGLASGEHVTTVVTDLTASLCTVQVDGSHGDVRLDGTGAAVLGATEASRFLVVACHSGATRVVAVDGDAAGLFRTSMSTLDPTRPITRVTLHDTPGRVVPSADPDGALTRAHDVLRVVLAAEQLGGMRACMRAIVEYVKVRTQFDRVVGSFQGVKHRLADMQALLEEAESIVRYAAWAMQEDPRDRAVAAALAQSHLGPGYFSLAKQHLLLFGGIGFTWEHDAHLYYKRAKSDEVLLGSPAQTRSVLADRLGLV